MKHPGIAANCPTSLDICYKLSWPLSYSIHSTAVLAHVESLYGVAGCCLGCKCTHRLDASDLRPAEDLSRPLDRAVRLQLEPMWHTLTWRSRCVDT